MSIEHTGTSSPHPPRSLREAWIALAGLSAVFLFVLTAVAAALVGFGIVRSCHQTA